MDEPIFDHEKLDVYRLSIDYVAFSCRIAKTLSGVNRPARDQWLRAAQSIPLNLAEGNGKQSLPMARIYIRVILPVRLFGHVELPTYCKRPKAH